MFDWLSGLIRRPLLTLAFGIALSLVSLWLAATRLHFTTDRTQLLDARAKVQLDWQRYLDEFGRTQDYVLLVRSNDPKVARQATDLLGKSLEESPHFRDVFYRLDLPEIAKHGLYFLTLEQIKQLTLWLKGGQPWMDLVTRQSTPGAVLQELSKHSGQKDLEDKLRPLVPVLIKTLDGLSDSLESGGRSKFVSPIGPFQADVEMLAGRDVEPGVSVFYNQLSDGLTYMVIAQPTDTSNSLTGDIKTLTELQALVGRVRRSYPDAFLMVSGEPAINTEEMMGAIRDAVRCAVTAVVLVALLLIFVFGQIGRPLCAMLSLLLGLSWSMGFAALSVGQLNLLTVHFGTILTGLGITFGIQFLCSYRVLRVEGRTSRSAAIASLPEARHQAVGAITTAIAFFSLHFTSFRAAAELGWITGVGVLLCYVATLTMLPSLLVLTERASRDSPTLWGGPWLAPMELWMRRRSRFVSLVCLAITLFSCSYFGRIPFDYNLLHMQPVDAEAIRVESFLSNIGYSTLYGISLAPNRDIARQRADAFSKLPSVSRVESLLALEPNDLQAKQAAVADLVALVPALKVPKLPEKLDAFELLELYNGYLALKPKLMRAARNLRQPEAVGQTLVQSLERLDRVLNPGNPGPLSSGMQSFQRSFLEDLEKQVGFLRQQVAEPPDILSLVPKEVRMRSISSKGLVCLRIFPKKDCWERENLGEFLAEMRSIDPDVTGTPVLIYSYLEQLRQAYNISGRNALIVITLLLLAYYRSITCAALALMPKLLGVAWMLGAMGVLGATFNAANFLALPLTLGIGLIFGIESLRMCQRTGHPLMSNQSAGFAVVLSGITTLLGFSILMGAEHRGVASFGLVMGLGVAMNLITSLVTLPAFMDWIRMRGLPENLES